MTQLSICVALEGFEPSQAEPESDVLPLHHKAIFVKLKSLILVALLPCSFYECKGKAFF